MKTLIVFESKHGTASHAAALLAEKLGGDVTAVKLSGSTVPSLGDFDAVIVGGSIYFGKIQKEVRQFAVKHTDELLRKKLGLFICGAHPDPKEREKELQHAFPEELLNHAAAKDIFGFQIHLQELNMLERNIARSILKLKEDKEGLDKSAIKVFAEKMKE